MLTVVIKNNGEDKVVSMTYANIWKEIKDIPEAELLVEWDWLDALSKTKNSYICFVEADCLVTSGYFQSQLGLLKKNKHFRKMAVMSSATSVSTWVNKIYGYNIGNSHMDGVIPNKVKKSTQPYTVEVAYIPGAILHVGMLGKLVETLKPAKGWQEDLVYFSTKLSLGFWSQGVGNGGMGNMVYINPNASYCTTEEYVNDIAKIDTDTPEETFKMFRSQSI